MVVQDSSPSAFLQSPEGEISFFRSIMRARPVGIHRYFHVLAIRNAIQKDTGHLISTKDIWEKLRSCYNLDALESLEVDGYDSPSSSNSTPNSIPSPSPTGDLSNHPFFRQEFTLPFDDSFESLVSARRMRTTASPPSSPAPSPSLPSTSRVDRERRGKSKLDMAGLVGGDSDSSALTQESGDEGLPTTRESVVTGTDAGTDYADEEDAEMHDSSPAPSASSKPIRGKMSKVGKRSAVGRTRAAATAGSSTRPGPPKKRKK